MTATQARNFPDFNLSPSNKHPLDVFKASLDLSLNTGLRSLHLIEHFLRFPFTWKLVQNLNVPGLEMIWFEVLANDFRSTASADWGALD